MQFGIITVLSKVVFALGISGDFAQGFVYMGVICISCAVWALVRRWSVSRIFF